MPLGLQQYLEPLEEYLVDADEVRLLLWSLPPALRVRLAHFARGALPDLLGPQHDLLLLLLLWLDPDGVQPQDLDGSGMQSRDTSGWLTLDAATDQVTRC